MSNLFSKLVTPRYPATALGLEKSSAAMVQLARGRNGVGQVRSAASAVLPESLISPSFTDPNISDRSELANVLLELATSVGLLRQNRWSVALPEGSTRSFILTLETAAASRRELEDVLRWKTERTLGTQLEELSISRARLDKDAQGRDRYLVLAARSAILEEYESVLQALGWRAGLLLPRHMGEAQWLTGNGSHDDALLLSTSAEGFTAVLFRDQHPLILRTVTCDAQEREDELYRLLLFYRDRLVGDSEMGTSIARLLVVGEGFNKERVRNIINETVGGNPRSLNAEDVGLQLPTHEFVFDAIAAPAGLATLSWR